MKIPSPLRAGALLSILVLAFSTFTLSGCDAGWGEFRPAVTAAVANQTVIAGQTATFSVNANAVGPIIYQWYKNGAPIAGATGRSYSTVAQAEDNNAVFGVRHECSGDLMRSPLRSLR